MVRLTSNEIIKLLNVLLSSLEPIGETNYDRQVADNLRIVLDISSWCLDRMLIARKYIEKSEYSMCQVGINADCYIKELRKWLNIIEEEE